MIIQISITQNAGGRRTERGYLFLLYTMIAVVLNMIRVWTCNTKLTLDEVLSRDLDYQRHISINEA